MADITLSSIVGQPRRQRFRLTSSDAAFPIPSWAQGGKGTVFVTASAAGASGAVVITADQRGGGGGSGAFSTALPMPIPAATTTMAVVVGAGGAAVTSDAATNGNAGGSTQVTVGSVMLNLGGGGAPNGTSGGVGGFGYLGSPISQMISNQVPLNFFSGGIPALADVYVRQGGNGGLGTNNQGGFGAGGMSLFGQAGPGVASVPGVTNGGNATGFGAGGAGAGTDAVAAATVTSGAGGPGFVDLEFVEGF